MIAEEGCDSRSNNFARNLIPAGVSAIIFTRRSPRSDWRRMMPRTSSLSTKPVIFEASQCSASANPFIFIGVAGVKLRNR